MNLKNKTLFILTIIIPLLVIIQFSKVAELSPKIFVALLAFYVIVYHPFISGLRLLKLGVIKKENFWKNFIPFWNFKYYVKLFLN